jgi:hypothetical protein
MGENLPVMLAKVMQLSDSHASFCLQASSPLSISLTHWDAGFTMAQTFGQRLVKPRS